jgi:hypothetical protein
VVADFCPAVALLLEVEQLPLSDAERLVDGLVQVGVLVFAQQMVGLVADHEFGATGNAEFDVHDRRDGAGEVLGALIDPNPARDQPVVEPFELGDPCAVSRSAQGELSIL